ncbi:uncharacterized protein K02A2.6-like [Ornithodoros turicata]|uniref:uncharacterized protein K02A2.6-like n=1 Tax=Ornithodoros turicata TaxID=34597 RepID=UPI003139DDC4
MFGGLDWTTTSQPKSKVANLVPQPQMTFNQFPYTVGNVQNILGRDCIPILRSTTKRKETLPSDYRCSQQWPEVVQVRRQTVTDTTKAFQEIFLRQGTPEQLVTDNGPQFTSADFKSFLELRGISHILTPPYHPKSNGQAENFVRSLKQALRRAQAGKEEEPVGTFLAK